MNEPTWLLKFKRDEFSQTGEDGIIEKILEILPSNDRWCVEFGAWDGLFLTNARHLIDSKGFSAVLIEADKKKFLDLRRNYAQAEKVTWSIDLSDLGKTIIWTISFLVLLFPKNSIFFL